MAESIYIGFLGPIRFESTASGVVFPGTVSATRFLGGDGTAAAPSFSFTNDSNSGRYLLGDGSFAESLNGTARMGLFTAGMQFRSDMLLSWSSGEVGGVSDVSVSRGAANLLQLAQDDNLSLVRGFIQGFEQTAPSAPAANGYRIFAVDNGGKTELMVLFQSGAAIQLAIEV